MAVGIDRGHAGADGVGDRASPSTLDRLAAATSTRRRSATAAAPARLGRGQQHGEFLAAHARHHVDLAEGVRQAVAQVAQHGVAGRVAVAVVDGLEVVGVEQDQGGRARPCARLRFSSSSAASKKARRLRDAGQVVAQRPHWRRPFDGVALVADVAQDQAIGRLAVAERPDRRSGSGEIMALAQNWLPSARRRRPSSRLQPSRVGFAQAVAQVFAGGRAGRIEHGIGLADRLCGRKAGDAADALVPGVRCGPRGRGRPARSRLMLVRMALSQASVWRSWRSRRTCSVTSVSTAIRRAPSSLSRISDSTCGARVRLPLRAGLDVQVPSQTMPLRRGEIARTGGAGRAPRLPAR